MRLIKTIRNTGLLVLFVFFFFCWMISDEEGVMYVITNTLPAVGQQPFHDGGIECYFGNGENVLPEISSVHPKKSSSIFFHETSCGRESDGRLIMLGRRACAVESAARMNPQSEVYLLFTSPVSTADLNEWFPLMLALEHYPNIRVMHVDFKKYFKDTPLEGWFDRWAFNTSSWPRAHASDVLRYLTLWKYGGTYLDLDFVVTKSLANMSNFVGMDIPWCVASAAMNFAADGVGHTVATECLQDMDRNFRGDIWGHNGPSLITRVLKRFCGLFLVWPLSPKECHGFKIHKIQDFYPIGGIQWRLLFDESRSNRTMARLAHAYMVHMSGSLSHREPVRLDSRQPYNLLAREFCPQVHASSGDNF